MERIISFTLQVLKPGVSIDEGDLVSFEVVEGERGPKAEKVEKA
jgi:CspA family cold shock protein